MKTRMIKGLTLVGIGAVVFGTTAAIPALADGRYGNDCGRPVIRNDNDRRDRDDHHIDRARFDRRDDRR